MIKKDVFIFSDPGIDDALAVALATSTNKIRILGACGTVGNVSSELAASNLASLFDLFGVHVPVFRGQSVLCPKLPFDPSLAHGMNGLGDVILPKSASSIQDSHQIIDTFELSDKISILSFGPLGDVANLLEDYPRVKTRIDQILLMGGSMTAGNVTTTAEFNIYANPKAANAVFNSGIPVKIVPLDVTQKVRLLEDDMMRIKQINSPISDALYRMLKFYFAFHKEFEGFSGCYTHDPLAVAALLWPEQFTFSRVPVFVDTRIGRTYGMTIFDTRCRSVNSNSVVEVATDVDVDRIKELMLSKVEKGILRSGHELSSNLSYT